MKHGRRLRCQDCASAVARIRNRRKRLVRQAARVPGERSLSLRQLGERDNWRCHICQGLVSPGRRFPDPECGTVDHLIPVSDDGTDAPENLRLAHLKCNSSRGRRGAVQLMLFG